tara:strand:+ start:1094 stop:1360 length:267 start_codon:yes stop_codon:yes gene_type:complete
MTAENIESDPNASNVIKDEAYWKRSAENAARAANREANRDHRKDARALRSKDRSIAMQEGRGRESIDKRDRAAHDFLKDFKNRPIFKN